MRNLPIDITQAPLRPNNLDLIRPSLARNVQLFDLLLEQLRSLTDAQSLNRLLSLREPRLIDRFRVDNHIQHINRRTLNRNNPPNQTNSKALAG